MQHVNTSMHCAPGLERVDGSFAAHLTLAEFFEPNFGFLGKALVSVSGVRQRERRRESSILLDCTSCHLPRIATQRSSTTPAALAPPPSFGLRCRFSCAARPRELQYALSSPTPEQPHRYINSTAIKQTIDSAPSFLLVTPLLALIRNPL